MRPRRQASGERHCFYLPSAAKLLEPLLTGREHAQIARRQWRSDASIEKIADACGASGIIDTPVRKCSDGMRQLIALTGLPCLPAHACFCSMSR